MSAENSDDSYEKVPYETQHSALTFPDRLATVAMLFGMTPPFIDRCRILELCCGNGNNIIAMAYALPDSQFLGIDYTASAIEKGKELIAKLGLKNIELRCMNVLDIDRRLGSFDYIISHGAYSWVPPEAKRKLLQIACDNLVPNGAAYISYNCYPGWRVREIARDLMVFHTERYDDPKVVIHQARSILDYAAGLVPPNQPHYKALLESEAKTVRSLNGWHLFHDYLERHNDPVLFSDFMKEAAKAGLQYVGDTEIPRMIPQEFPQDVQAMLARLSDDLLRLEQYMDFLRNRAFRRTVLCRADVQLRREFSPGDIELFHIACPMQRVKQPDGKDRFIHPNGGGMQTTEPALTAAVNHLSMLYPRSATFQELLVVSRPFFSGLLMNEQTEETQKNALASGLLKLCLAGLAEFRTHVPKLAVEPGLKPRASKLARLQAEKQTFVTNLLHDAVELSDFAREVIRLLDGTRDYEAVLQALQNAAPADPVRKSRSALQPRVDQTIKSLFRAALLVSGEL